MLRTENVTIRIGNKTICQQVCFTAQAGEIWGILGPNGCGKTTLLHSLAGQHTPQSGNIYLNQQPIKKLSTKIIAQHIGILFQDFHAHFPQTIWDYCSLARYPHQTIFKKLTSLDKQIIHRAVTDMELIHLSKHCVTQLSGGEKRRLALAALLTQTPRIYLLDEPTNHLDICHQQKVFEHFRSLAHQQAIVIMSLHDINLAQECCDHMILMMGDGEVITGLTNEVLTPNNLSRLYQHPIDLVKKTFWVAA